ncbi:MAG: hypothetical protein ACXIUD_02065 [Mongoliitalea sp.]
MRYLKVITLLLAPFLSFSQKLEGFYLGSLISDQDLLIIEKEKDHFLVTLQSAKNNPILMVGIKLDNKIKFDIPLDSGEELEVTASKKDDVLSLAFELDKKLYTIDFEPVKQPSIPNKNSSSNHSKDERLVGTWIEKQTFTVDGILDKELDNSSKNYKVTYTKDGRLILDSRIFRDLAKKYGYKFDFSDIPMIYWSTDTDATLFTEMPAINQTMQSAYQINGDSLIILEEKVKRFFIKAK